MVLVQRYSDNCVHVRDITLCYFMQVSITSRVQVPYGYSPVLAVNADTLETTRPLVSKFLEASSKGWQDFVNEPQACAAQVCSLSALNL